jgi:hypothetical protein
MTSFLRASSKDKKFTRFPCYLFARSQRDPGYTILLRPGTTDDAAFNVHSFRDGQPVGHRDYDRLDGGSPIQNALQEFAGEGWKLETMAKPSKGVEWAEYTGRANPQNGM